MKISTIIFTLILIYNSVLSFVLFNPGWCSDSKNNKMYSTFTNAYLFNLIINTIILISIATNSYTPSTLLGGILLASYGWLFAISYGLYKEDNTPDCLKRIAMTTMVFASLFMILIPVAVLLFNESINKSVIKTICGDETGNKCKDKMVEWYKRNVNEKIDKVTATLKKQAIENENKLKDVRAKVSEKYKEFKTKDCEQLKKDLDRIKEDDRKSIRDASNRLTSNKGILERIQDDEIPLAKIEYENETNPIQKDAKQKAYDDLRGTKSRLEEYIKDDERIEKDLTQNNTDIENLISTVDREIRDSRCPAFLFKNAKQHVDKANTIYAKDRDRGIIPY